MTPGSAAMRLLRPLLISVTLLFAFAGLFASAGVEAAAPKGRPAWAELTVEQQQILAPLKRDWEQIEPAGRRKWIGVAKRYPTMTPTGQVRVQRRMEAWANLSPEQRRQARENYRDISKLPPEKKQDLKEQWVEYQALSAEEKRRIETPPKDAKSAERKSRAKPPAPKTAPSPQTQPSGK